MPIRRSDRSLLRAGALIVAAGLLGACASPTRLETSWRNPSATASSFEFKNLLVVVMARDGAIRRSAEDELVRAVLAGPRAQAGQLQVRPSYQALGPGDPGPPEAVRAAVKAGGYDGMVLIAFVSTEQRISVEPGSVQPAWGYYGRTRGVVYDPGEVRSDTILRLETSIYAFPAEELLWSGVTRTTNPRDVARTAGEVARAVAEELRRQGLLP